MYMNAFENVCQEISKLIPSSVINDIACFVFYDNHPKSDKNIDITVCTKAGEIREYSQRDLQCSLNLNCPVNQHSELRILRNNNSELYYLLATKDELFIISSKKKLEILKKLTNIDRYDINDLSCNGETYLKIIRKDDGVPILFDNNFQCLEDRGVIITPQNMEDSLPILDELKKKLVEARYTVKCNEKTYEEYLSLHQKVSLLNYQCQQPISDRAIFQDDIKIVRGNLKLETQKPWIKVCNNKLICILKVFLQGTKPIENLHILLNNSNKSSLVYTTKVFTKIPAPPYWQQCSTTILKPEQACIVTAALSFEEFQQNVLRIELNGSISYKIMKKEYLLPFEEISISSMDVMGDEFDVLSSCEPNHEYTILAILAATEKTELCLRHIRNNDEPGTSLLDLFCTHVQMDRVENTSNIIVYKKSPYHALNGTMMIFHDGNTDEAVPVSVHTRSQSQVLALLHLINDSIPTKIISTLPTYKITAKTEALSKYNEEISSPNKQTNYLDYATSILNRSGVILEYLDSSMIKMNESKDPAVQSKVGSHIDIFAAGVDKFKEFTENMQKEMEIVESLMELKMVDSMDSEVMYID